MPNPASSGSGPIGTVVGRRPTTLSARAAERLAAGPLDAVTLMRDVCRVDRLQRDAAERMAIALLSSHDEFVQLPSGHWALRTPAASVAAPASTGTLRVADRANFGDGHERSSGDGGSIDGASSNESGLRAVNFAVVDVETTGTRAGRGDRITEIAIARVQGGQIVEVYSQLVNPQRPIPSFITQLTHISWDMVKDQPTFREVSSEITSRLAGHVFVAHNAAFDWRFVSEELALSGVQLSGPRLCTVRMARQLLPQLARRTLDHVTRHFGIDIEGRHRAAGDAEATAKVLLRMMRIAEDEGLNTWPLLEARVSGRSERVRRTASDRRRRAFPLPAIEDHIA